jgi:hypothetical protein
MNMETVERGGTVLFLGINKSDLLCSAVYIPNGNTNTKQEQRILLKFKRVKRYAFFTDHIVWFKSNRNRDPPVVWWIFGKSGASDAYNVGRGGGANESPRWRGATAGTACRRGATAGRGRSRGGQACPPRRRPDNLMRHVRLNRKIIFFKYGKKLPPFGAIICVRKFSESLRVFYFIL